MTTFVLVAVLMGDAYQATPVVYPTRKECDHVAQIFQRTARLAKYRCEQRSVRSKRSLAR